MFSLITSRPAHWLASVSLPHPGGSGHRLWHEIQSVLELAFDAQRPDSVLPLVAKEVLRVADTFLLIPHTAEEIEEYITQVDPKKYPCRPSFKLYRIGSVLESLVAQGLITKQGGGKDATYLRLSVNSGGLHR
jgi:hypothetical protein